MGLIYKIIAIDEWRLAEETGVFNGSAVDRADGYIHFSTAEQVAKTAAKWFANRADLHLVAVDAKGLGEALRWEISRDDALFPHLYSALPMSAVRWQRALPIGGDGRHEFGRLEA